MIKKLIGYYILCFLLWICAVLYASYELWTIVIFMALFPIVMYVSLRIIKNKVEIKPIIHEDKVAVDDNITIEIMVDNKTILPILFIELEIESVNSFYNVVKKEKLDITTIKYGKQSFSFLLSSKCCGNIKVKISNVKIKDYMKIIKMDKKIDVSKDIPVMPNIVIPECEKIPENSMIAADSDVFSKTEKGNDPSEVFDYRKYVEGDELNTINWKMSARCGEYIVKEHSKPITSGIVILVELFLKDKKDNKKMIDAIITTLVGLSIRILELGIEHTIVWYDEEKNELKSIDVKKSTMINEILNKIYESRFYYDSKRLIENYNQINENNKNTHLYYIGTTCESEDIIALSDNNDNIIKRYILIGEESVEKEKIEESEDNDILLQKISIENVEESIMALQF